MRAGALVAREARESSVLRDWRGRGIGAQLACELLLQAFDQVMIETSDTPKQVDVIRRRLQHVAGWRQVSTSFHAREHRRAIVVGIDKNVSNGADRIACA
jgi:hypothetical protein